MCSCVLQRACACIGFVFVQAFSSETLVYYTKPQRDMKLWPMGDRWSMLLKVPFWMEVKCMCGNLQYVLEGQLGKVVELAYQWWWLMRCEQLSIYSMWLNSFFFWIFLLHRVGQPKFAMDAARLCLPATRFCFYTAMQSYTLEWNDCKLQSYFPECLWQNAICSHGILQYITVRSVISAESYV